LELYSQNELDTALLRSAVAGHPGNADSYAWVAETARRLRQFGLVEHETEAVT